MRLNKNPFSERHFITRPGEKLLFAARRHIFSLLLPITSTVIFLVTSVIVAFVVQSYLHFSGLILVGILFFALLAAGTILMKLAADWYFHFFIITNYKILEVCYKPFFSKNISVIPLDQMRCVEVVANTYGFINTVYDIGDITVILDFLTHQDTFVMTNIASPQRTSIMLSDIFNAIITDRNVDKNVAPFSMIPGRSEVPLYSSPSFNVNRRTNLQN